MRGPGIPRPFRVDPLLRRSLCAAGQPASSLVRRRIGLSASDRKFPPLTARSGTPMRPYTTVGSEPWSSSPAGELRITRVFPCVARGLKARASFMLAGCCWWRSLAIDGGSGTSRGHGSVMRRPGSRRRFQARRLASVAGHGVGSSRAPACKSCYPRGPTALTCDCGRPSVTAAYRC